MLAKVGALDSRDIFIDTRSRLLGLLLVLGGSLFIALSAQLSFLLPFSPVPVTGQTLAVLLVGAMLGRKLGAYSVAAYLFEGAMGLPVFSFGTGGIFVLSGPTAGYLLGFVPAAYLTGYFFEKNFDKTAAGGFLAMTVSMVTIYAFGFLWLAGLIGIRSAFICGILPFIAGDIFKICVGCLFLQSIGRLGRDCK